MLDVAIDWILHNPLLGVGAMSGLAVIIGLVLVPGLHSVAEHGPPKC